MLRQGVASLLRRSSVNILTAWPGRVAQALRAGRARAPWSCSPCWRPSRDAQSWGISYSSTTKRTRKSPTEVTRARVPSAGHFRRRFANFQPQRATADPRIGMFCANGPRIKPYESGKTKVGAGPRGSARRAGLIDGAAGLFSICLSPKRPLPNIKLHLTSLYWVILK